jgi:hypothetical protein
MRVSPALFDFADGSITERITPYSELFEKALTRLLGFLLWWRLATRQVCPKGESQTRLRCMQGERSQHMIVCASPRLDCLKGTQRGKRGSPSQLPRFWRVA